MQRVWFNKTFSSVATAMRLIRKADLAATGGQPRYHIVCSNTNAHAAAFLAAHEYAVEPAGLTGLNYVEWCLEFCRDRNITIFWPGKEAGLVGSASARFAAIGTRVLSVASEDTLALMHDKARFCDGLDLPMARPADYRAVTTIAEYDAAYAELRPLHGKLCIKPSESVYGLGFAVLDEERSSAQLLLAGAAYQVNAQELRSGLAQMATFKTLLLMEYLDGHEYSADCVADQGTLICAVPRKKLHGGGSGQLIELRADLLAACEKLARDYRLNGVFNIQFRVGANGLALLEINPRMSGGIGMACAAGPNLPYLALAGFDQGYDKLTVPAIREGMRVAEAAYAVGAAMNLVKKQMPTGELTLKVDEARFPLDWLIGFAARANAKRGFLFLSKVLGKHWPVTPRAMEAIHDDLAAQIPPSLPGPVVFIAMAETAVGLGQGVFEAWLRANPNGKALFLHSSRYRVGTVPFFEFEESHSHAPRQFLHLSDAASALFSTARSLVLIDDEASTGNTFANLVQVCRARYPQLEKLHLGVITNFMGQAANAGLTQRFGLPTTVGAALSGHYAFQAGAAPAPVAASAQRFEANAERGASPAFGRIGVGRALNPPQGLAVQLAQEIGAGDSVLVLGTGEFMHPSFLLARELESLGKSVVVQSTTRSPILSWGSVGHIVNCDDNYGEGIANYLYNVAPGQYQHVFICHETPASPALMQLAGQLNGRLFHFQSETKIEEIPVC